MNILVPSGITSGSTATIPYVTTLPFAVRPYASSLAARPLLAGSYQVA